MYLVYQHYSTASKNKLEEEFFQHLKSIDRMLISEDKIEFFKYSLFIL